MPRFLVPATVGLCLALASTLPVVSYANPLDSISIDSVCDSTTHTVTVKVHDIDTIRSITIVGQDRVGGSFQDSGSQVTASIPVGTTQFTMTITIPFVSGTDAYRVRVVSSTLDNSSGIVSNTVGCDQPTPAPTSTRVPPTPTYTPTVTYTARATDVPPTSIATSTSVPTIATSGPGNLVSFVTMCVWEATPEGGQYNSVTKPAKDVPAGLPHIENVKPGQSYLPYGTLCALPTPSPTPTAIPTDTPTATPSPTPTEQILQRIELPTETPIVVPTLSRPPSWEQPPTQTPIPDTPLLPVPTETPVPIDTPTDQTDIVPIQLPIPGH